MIDREILEDIIGDHELCEVQETELRKVIKCCSEIQDWIPCSERLPEKECVTSWTGHYLTVDEDGYMEVLPYCEGWNCHRGLDGKAYKDTEITGIVAWMPLPEPYESED